MNKSVKVAAFKDGELHVLENESSSREVALALPLSRLLLKVVRVPAGEDPVETARPLVKALSPFPDEPLAVSCETVYESEEGSIVLAAALPEGSTDDLAEALDAAKLNVVKIDALALGAIRDVWSDLSVEDGRRRLLIIRDARECAFVVLDCDRPVSIRAVDPEANLQRETWLSLLEAEDFGGPRELAETVERELVLDRALAGVAARAEDESTLNALPDSWREVLEESRFKSKMNANLAWAGGLWALVLAVLLGVPIVYGFMTDHVKGLIKAHSKAYRAVADKKAKTELVRRYSDHARGALEIMKAISDRLPGGVTLSDWRFSREKGVSFRGETENKDEAYELKDRLVAMGVYPTVELGAVTFQAGRHRFEITCSSEEADE